jgi:thioredoxin 1
MKKSILFLLVIFLMVYSGCSSNKNDDAKSITNTSDNAVIPLNEDYFKKTIYNYDLSKEWKYEGTQPVIIDFYADWCPPCRQLSPLVEEIAKEYQGKILVYKVNTDQEKLLAQSLGITNLPTLLYIPSVGMPHASMGYVPKDAILKTIKEVLLTR